MPALPRLLVLIGSGETTASMAPVHRRVLARLREGGHPIRAAMLDTPYAFEENAARTTQVQVDYFGARFGLEMAVASLPRSDGDPLARQEAIARIRGADLIFSGPGSPTYAVRHWSRTEVPTVLAEKLHDGGAVILASAAALSVGRLTAPIYDIYKVGADPHWLPGLDVLSRVGLPVAVVPHWDNGEGAGHDTRYCFLGERRMRILENQLPDDVFMLGIDEHTALVIDVATGRGEVLGRGGVSVRRAGSEARFLARERARPTIDDLRAAASLTEPTPEPTEGSTGTPGTAGAGSTAAGAERAFRDALERAEPGDAVRALLILDDLAAAAADATRAAELRAAERWMLVRLADALRSEASERLTLVEGLVAALIEARDAARSSGNWAAADALRDRLRALGIEVHDARDATSWSVATR
jgi:cyanophycinase-like exopeptidase